MRRIKKKLGLGEKDCNKFELLLCIREQLVVLSQNLNSFNEKYPEESKDFQELYDKVINLRTIPETILKKEFNFWF